jgi:hypothetical protein
MIVDRYLVVSEVMVHDEQKGGERGYLTRRMMPVMSARAAIVPVTRRP